MKTPSPPAGAALTEALMALKTFPVWSSTAGSACMGFPGVVECAYIDRAEVLRLLAAHPAPSPADAADAARLDWIERQGDEFSSGTIVDMPGDGDCYVHGCGKTAGQGKTFRDAIDSAMKGTTP